VPKHENIISSLTYLGVSSFICQVAPKVSPSPIVSWGCEPEVYHCPIFIPFGFRWAKLRIVWPQLKPDLLWLEGFVYHKALYYLYK
jgi:hypothetical protein